MPEIFQPLRDVIVKYLPPEKVELVHKAYLLGAKAHEGQTRISGEPYITHPVAVATILAQMHLDAETLIAAILHDVIEDTDMTKEALAAEFGERVADLVDGVSKLTQIKFETRKEAQAENFRKMILAMAKDLRVILVKLADRLHNMRTIGALSLEKRRRIALETLDIYAPIAQRLGMYNIRQELENLGFAALYPMRNRILGEQLRKSGGDRGEVIAKIVQKFKNCLAQHNIEVLDVWGREKHLYSIFKKMRKLHIPFSDLMDIYTFRVIVPTVEDCYRTLGALHNLYKPVPARFRDYIAIPKGNGYQSLHTTLFGPYGIPIQIHIRTKSMDLMADSGIAAHWLSGPSNNALDEAHERSRAWVKNLLEMQEATGSSEEFFENVKVDLFPDEVFVFTPGGDILKLPAGATAVDFAYAVHSDIGSSCVAVKIDRRLSPLSTELVNGQTIEVITAPGAKPNPAWLNFVVTAKAKSSIRHFLKGQKRQDAIILGKRLLERALGTLSCDLKAVLKEKIDQTVASTSASDFDDLCSAIGLGEQMAMVIARRLAGTVEDEPGEIAGQDGPLVIKGSEGMIVTFAHCCCPIPYDPIVGLLSSGNGLLVHRANCSEANRSGGYERQIPLRWEGSVNGEFVAEIQIEAENKRGVLANLTATIAEAEANIEDMHVEPGGGQCSVIKMGVSVADRTHLAKTMRKIRGMNTVSRVFRLKAGA